MAAAAVVRYRTTSEIIRPDFFEGAPFVFRSILFVFRDDLVTFERGSADEIFTREDAFKRWSDIPTEALCAFQGKVETPCDFILAVSRKNQKIMAFVKIITSPADKSWYVDLACSLKSEATVALIQKMVGLARSKEVFTIRAKVYYNLLDSFVEKRFRHERSPVYVSYLLALPSEEVPEDKAVRKEKKKAVSLETPDDINVSVFILDEEFERYPLRSTERLRVFKGRSAWIHYERDFLDSIDTSLAEMLEGTINPNIVYAVYRGSDRNELIGLFGICALPSSFPSRDGEGGVMAQFWAAFPYYSSSFDFTMLTDAVYHMIQAVRYNGVHTLVFGTDLGGEEYLVPLRELGFERFSMLSNTPFPMKLQVL